MICHISIIFTLLVNHNPKKIFILYVKCFISSKPGDINYPNRLVRKYLLTEIKTINKMSYIGMANIQKTCLKPVLSYVKKCFFALSYFLLCSFFWIFFSTAKFNEFPIVLWHHLLKLMLTSFDSAFWYYFVIS